MKKILLLISVLLFSQNVYAEDSINWEEYSTYVDYNIENQLLLIRTSIFTSTPDDIYSMNMRFGDESCDKALSYKSYYLTAECSFFIASGEITGLYRGDLSIFDAHENKLYEDTVKIKVPKYKAKNLDESEYNIDYDAGSGKMNIFGHISSNVGEFYDGYIMKISDIREFEYEVYEGTTLPEKNQNGTYDIVFDKYVGTYIRTENYGKYTTRLAYDNETEELSFDVKIKNKWSVGSGVSMDYQIFDKNKEVVGEGKFIKILDTGMGDDISWKTFRGDYWYDRDASELHVKAYISGIEKNLKEDYIIDISKNSKELIYDANSKQIYAEFVFDHDKFKQGRKRTFRYKILGSNQVIEEGEFILRDLDYHKKSYNSIEEDIDTEEKSQQPSKFEFAVDNLISKQQEKYPNIEDLKNNLILTIQVLSVYAEKNPRYKEIIDELNNIIQERVNHM